MFALRTATGLAASSALALLLAGCGGGGGDDGGSAALSAGTSPSAGASTAGAPRATSTTSPATNPPGTATSAGPARCATAQLRLGLGAAQGAAGSTYRPMTFVNTGSATCTLDGHPGVSYVAGDDGHQVGAAAARTGTPTVVTLAAGATAHATLRVVNDQNYDAATCRPTAVTGLRVYPPDQTAAAFVPAAGTGCAATGVVLLTIGPVSAGATD